MVMIVLEDGTKVYEFTESEAELVRINALEEELFRLTGQGGRS